MNGNHMLLVGNMVQDPELRVSKKGNHWTTFSIARSYSIGDAGEKETDFFDCKVLSANLTDNIVASLKKGTRVQVTGHFKQERWDDKDTGKARSKLVLICETVAIDLTWASAEVTRNPFDSPAPVAASDDTPEFSEEPF